MIRQFCRTIVLFYAKCFFRHKTYGKKNLIEGAAILAANHVSYLDPPLVGISYPGKVHFLAKSTLMKKPFYKWFFKKLLTHPLERGRENVSTFRLAERLLISGQKIVLFPEGHRSKTGSLQKGEAGIGLLVMRTKAPIIPVYIHGAYEIWNIHQKKPKKFTGKTACVFGKPLYFDDLIESERKEAKQEIADRVMESIAELKSWYLKGRKGNPP